MSRILLLVCFLALSLSGAAIAPLAQAQSGFWVGEPYSPFGSGSMLYQAGASGLGVTYQEANRLLFFSVVTGGWTALDLEAEQEWFHLDAEGDLVLALSDTFAVAFNARTGNAHALRYEGALLSTTPPQQSWDLGPCLALLVTYDRMYVFDAGLDAWRDLDYGLPAAYQFAHQFHVGEDFAAMSLQPTYPAPPMNVAYSHPRHAFAQTDTGTPYFTGTAGLDHGFAGTSLDGDVTRLVGYSATTGDFDVETLLVDDAGLQVWTGDQNGAYERTVCAASVNEPIDYDAANYHIWGYDSRAGSWIHHVEGYDPSNYGMGLAGVGGQLALFLFTEDLSTALSFLLYNGREHRIEYHGPSEFYHQDTSGIVLGGTALGYTNENGWAWGYSIETGQGLMTSIGGIVTWQQAAGENYVSFGRWTSGQDRMTRLFYNGSRNTWSTTETWKDIVVHETCGSHLYAEQEWHASEPIDTFFYSSLLDVLVSHAFSAATNSRCMQNDGLAVYWSDVGEAALFDARRGILELVPDRTYSLESLNEHLAVAISSGQDRLYGYSQVSGLWTEHDPGEMVELNHTGALIGWAADPAPTRNYFVYNALCDTWVELRLGSNSLGTATGGRTMLVIHPDTLYAFDLECEPTSVAEPGDTPEADLAPRRPVLHPAQPNPFNPRTELAFELMRAGRVTLHVHDARGRLVNTLVEAHLPAGTHHVTWDGRDLAGRRAASGVYMVRLTVADFTTARKLVLLQ